VAHRVSSPGDNDLGSIREKFEPAGVFVRVIDYAGDTRASLWFEMLPDFVGALSRDRIPITSMDKILIYDYRKKK
jgi:hypothetical protein